MKKFLIIIIALFFALTSKSQDFALAQLESSPRHQEWQIINNGDKEIHSFIVYPEVSEKATVVIVIHENRGLTDWVRSFADQLAAEGYIAIAPDLLSDFSQNFKRTSDFPVSDDARAAIYELKPDQVDDDLLAIQAYGQELPASNGKTAVMGFCWGGSTTFRFATKAVELEAAMVFYGTGPKEQAEYATIETPVYGFYGKNDERVNSTIPDSKKMMDIVGKSFDYAIYEGVGHAYMRAADAPDADDNAKAAKKASMTKIKEILK
uniref:dienelactone hydrolase family protein n=1 Tax=Fulvivirga sp. TaxID=1931237 RepID=UPI0040496FDA